MRSPSGAAPRICVLTSVHHPFDQRVFYKEAVSLAQNGMQVTLVAPAAAALRGEHSGVWLEPVPPSRTRRERLASQWRLLRLARRVDADLYHIHDPELLPLACWLRRDGRRVIYDVHENFAAAALTRAWVPKLLRRPLAALVDLGERHLARRLDAVVGVVVEQGERFPHRPFALVRNFPRLECFAPHAAAAVGQARPGDGAELLHVGSLSRDRGSQFLLEILRELRRTHPQVRLDALGPFHSRAEQEAFQAAVRDFGLQDTVRQRTERLAYDQLGGFIAAHRIGLIPGQVSAKNLTPFVPTKLFEYLACGLPVVASDLPSIRGFREQGAWGVLAPPDDPAAHAAAIARLLDDPAAAAAMGTAGRHFVESSCNWDAEARVLLDLYARMLPAGHDPMSTMSGEKGAQQFLRQETVRAEPMPEETAV